MLSMLPIQASHIYVYPVPINMQLGQDKLIDICENKMQLSPEDGLVFLFFNKAQNKIKLFYLDDTGSQEIMKFLPKGGFLLPDFNKDQKYIKIDSNELTNLLHVQIH